MGNFDGDTNAHKPGKAALYDVQRHDRLWILLRLFERPRKHQYLLPARPGTTANAEHPGHRSQRGSQPLHKFQYISAAGDIFAVSSSISRPRTTFTRS
jgi:hypothetical protein